MTQECCLSVTWPLCPCSDPWCTPSSIHSFTYFHCWQRMSPTPPSSQLHFLFSAVQFSHCPVHHHASPVSFLLPSYKTRAGGKREKHLSTSKKHRDEWLFTYDCWENGAAVFANAEWERVCGFWKHMYEPCTVWGHTSISYEQKA